MKIIWWIKRDIRTFDNEALWRAVDEGDAVLPLYIFEPSLIHADESSALHLHSQITALNDLRARLQSAGGDILIARGEALNVFKTLNSVWKYDAVYSHQETGSNVTFVRDQKVKIWFEEQEITWNEYHQNGVLRGKHSHKKRFKVAEKRLADTKLFKAPEDYLFPDCCRSMCQKREIPQLTEYFSSENLQDYHFNEIQTVSECAAQETMKSFTQNRGCGYSGGISSPNTAFKVGSRLSPHLAWGTYSLRQAYLESYKKYHSVTENKRMEGSSAQWQRSMLGFKSRLHWHDHFIQRLESSSTMEFKCLNPAYEKIEYYNDDDNSRLNAWLSGTTGFPLIDACMRCLQATGFINFRMRAMVVSFAIYGLNLDWRTFQYPLAKLFIDYEPGIHFSQIQMQAGIVGINTIRVYNPTKQQEDQDPRCEFIKKWIPDLQEFSPEQILLYEKFPLGDYPKTVINFRLNSKSMKDQIFAIRKSYFGKTESLKVLEKHGSKSHKKKRKKSLQKKQDSKEKNTLQEKTQISLF